MRKKKTIDYKKLAGLADEDTSDVQNVITKEEYFSSCSLCCSMRALSKSVKNDLLSNGQSLNEFILSFSAAQTELNFLSSEDQICDECFRYVQLHSSIMYVLCKKYSLFQTCKHLPFSLLWNHKSQA